MRHTDPLIFLRVDAKVFACLFDHRTAATKVTAAHAAAAPSRRNERREGLPSVYAACTSIMAISMIAHCGLMK